MSDVLIGVLGALGIGSIIGAIITGLFSKRKLGAEATEIITKAASGVVTMLEAQLASQATEYRNQLSSQEASFALERAGMKAKLDEAVATNERCRTEITNLRAEVAELRARLRE